MKQLITLIAILTIALNMKGQNVYIPDANFKAALVGDTLINTNKDGEIQVVEALTFTGAIDVLNKGIKDLTGIEAFTSLNALYISDNYLKHINLSANSALTRLNCANDSLTALDLTSNTNLHWLNCSFNQLHSLDLSSNRALDTLSCSFNHMTSLNVTSDSILKLLYCFENDITSLDLSSNVNLAHLICRNNLLSNLNLSFNEKLSRLNCSINNLTSLNLSTNKALTELICASNLLSFLDLTQNTNLSYIDCIYNDLRIFNIRNGNNYNIDSSSFLIDHNLNLNCIQVDDSLYSSCNWRAIDPWAHFSTNCNYVGINESSSLNDLTLYPNPAGNELRIDNGELIIREVKIFNALGEAQPPTPSRSEGEKATIDVSSLRPGIYFVQITDASGRRVNRKIVKA